MIEDLAAVIDRLVEADPHSLSDGESVLALRRQLARLDVVTARAAAAFETDGEWMTSGARTAAQWLFRETCEPAAVVKRSLRVGRALRTMPGLEEACVAGDVTVAHADVLVRVKTPATAEAYERDEAMLVDNAKRMRFDRFQRTADYWLQVNGPDDAEKKAARQVEQRNLSLSRGFYGSWEVNGTLDPINGAIVYNELHRIEAELFHADWHETKERLGRKPTLLDLPRNALQRRADALVEMAARSAATPAGAQRPQPLFSVFVGYETFAGRICELANGTVVAPGQLAGWLTEALVERVVFDSPSRVIDVGVTRRLFTGATRHAVKLRDQECYHHYCDMPADWCQIDHKHPWSAGGLTIEANGRPACGFHNRRRNGAAAGGDRRESDDPP